MRRTRTIPASLWAEIDRPDGRWHPNPLRRLATLARRAFARVRG